MVAYFTGWKLKEEWPAALKPEDAKVWASQPPLGDNDTSDCFLDELFSARTYTDIHSTFRQTSLVYSYRRFEWDTMLRWWCCHVACLQNQTKSASGCIFIHVHTAKGAIYSVEKYGKARLEHRLSLSIEKNTHRTSPSADNTQNHISHYRSAKPLCPSNISYILAIFEHPNVASWFAGMISFHRSSVCDHSLHPFSVCLPLRLVVPYHPSARKG